MWSGFVKVTTVLFGLCAGLHAAENAEFRVVMPEKHFGFFEKYCLDCHDEATEKGKVDLENLSFDLGTIESAELWQKVLNSINSGEMPPEDKTQPTPGDKTDFLEALSQRMVDARNLHADTGGLITMRRLNRREYENTMESLLGVKVDASNLPDDSNPGGFDTEGGALFFSSDQFEQYIKLAREALDRAIVTGEKPQTVTQRIEAEEEANQRVRMVFRGYQKRGYIAWKKFTAGKGKVTPKEVGLVDEKEIDFRKLVWDRSGPDYADYLSRKETWTGAFLTVSSPNPQVGLAIPDQAPAGKYKIRALIGVNGRPEPARTFVEVGYRGENIEAAIDLIGCRKVRAPLSKPEVIEFDIDLPPLSKPLSMDVGTETGKKVPIGERVIAFRQRHPNSRNAARYIRMQSVGNTGFNIEPSLWVDWLEWEGPVIGEWPPASHKEIFFRGKGAEKNTEYAREILARFARKAFRIKDANDKFLRRLTDLYQSRREGGESFEEAMKMPLSIILASPGFLYLKEPGGDTENRELTDKELAVRLSYFLWSTAPDARLRQAAEKGQLSTRKGLLSEVNRLLGDDRIDEFVQGFAHQWLHMDRLDFFQFNYRLYPEFDDSVKMAARLEVFETIRYLIDRNRPIGELLKTDRIVINDLLADYYGIKAVHGAHFRAVKVPEDLPRGGLPGMAAILAMGSDGEQSSPVERGSWVLRKLLHDPPPPAPANVPQLSRHAGKLLPARELLEAHMEEAQCAQCHRKIDPIGYGLEHFNAAGQWREKEYTEIATNNRVRKFEKHPIDDTGTLPDGTAFHGFFELRDRLAEREQEFARGFVEHLIEYALGRPYGFSDQQLADDILSQGNKQGGTLKAYILALVQSEPFRIK